MAKAVSDYPFKPFKMPVTALCCLDPNGRYKNTGMVQVMHYCVLTIRIYPVIYHKMEKALRNGYYPKLQLPMVKSL